MDLLHFLNLQYWYCIIYSLFGGHCAYLDQLNAAAEAEVRPGVFEQLVNVFTSVGAAVWGPLSSILSAVWDVYSAFMWSVSGFLFFSILSTLAMLLLLRFREQSMYGTLPPKTDAEKSMRDYWDSLLDGALSSEPARWRESILAADRMLGDLLELLGVPGATTPDRMRNLPEQAFLTVPQAWEAHRVRNLVSSAHSDFILTQREAYRVMKLYEQVFEEHQYI